ncbi:hypothetical protein BDV09DRAFT_175581 [Aspergillus tetrazonus]
MSCSMLQNPADLQDTKDVANQIEKHILRSEYDEPIVLRYCCQRIAPWSQLQ